jgi:hypothetical protein
VLIKYENIESSFYVVLLYKYKIMSIRNLLTSGLPANASLDIVCDTLTANTINGSSAPDETYTLNQGDFATTSIPSGINVDSNNTGSLYLERYGNRVYGWLIFQAGIQGEPNATLTGLQLDVNLPATMRPPSNKLRTLATVFMTNEAGVGVNDKDGEIGYLEFQAGQDLFIRWVNSNWLPDTGLVAINIEISVPAFSYLTNDPAT